MSIGENIKRLRKQKGLTQKQLGILCQPPIDEANIRKYENDKQNPKIGTLQKIAEALEISIADLMDLDDFKRKPIIGVYHFHKIFEDLANNPYGYSEDEKKEMAIKINNYINQLESIEDEDESIIYYKITISALTHEILTHLLSPYLDKNIEDITELVAFYLQLDWNARDLVIELVKNLYGNEKLRIKNDESPQE